MVIRQAVWDGQLEKWVLQLQPVVNKRSWIGHVVDPGEKMQAALLFPERDLNELLDEADVLETVDSELR